MIAPRLRLTFFCALFLCATWATGCRSGAAPSATVPSATVPSATVPSATVPSATVPSATVPSATVPTAPVAERAPVAAPDEPAARSLPVASVASSSPAVPGDPLRCELGFVAVILEDGAWGVTAPVIVGDGALVAYLRRTPSGVELVTAGRA